IQATSNDGKTRTIAGRLDTPGQRLDLSIVLAAVTVPMGGLTGTVYEADGTTAHPNAEVFVIDPNSHAIVASTRADANGMFSFDSVPSGAYEAQAISFDGRRATSRRAITIPAGATSTIFLALQDVASVTGIVQFANGQPVSGAIVAGGESL